MPHAKDLAAMFDATLILYHVFTPPPPLELAVTHPVYVAGYRILNTLEAQTYLDEWAEKLGSKGLRVETVVRLGDPADMILADSQTLGASLVIMATHGRSGLGGVFFGSVATSVLRHGTLPMLLVRPGNPQPAEA